MNRFEEIKEILERAVGGGGFGGHGAFWRGQTRDQFVAHVVFGYPLLVVGDGENSNIVKALEGRNPFDGSFFRRMPAGRDPVPDEEIAIIRRWIDDGCPVDAVEDEPFFDHHAAEPAAVETHLTYWRELDSWSLFNRTPEVDAAIGRFFPNSQTWMLFARGLAAESEWENAIRDPETAAAIELLARRQRETVEQVYGRPAPILQLLDAYERFGDDTLPADPLRPQDPRHNMNGPIMWFVWSAFHDACLRLELEPEFWRGHARALLLGLLNDGLFRGRFQVTGFAADDAGKDAMRAHVRELDDDRLQPELMSRLVDSGFAS